MTTPQVMRVTDPYPAEFEFDAVLADGGLARIRPIRPGDADALTHFHEHLSSETTYRRFLGTHPHLRAEEIERFTRVDYRERLALVAEVDGHLGAVARYDHLRGTARAEVAFVVADALQGHGLGTLLLEHLAVAARRRGVAAFVAQTLASNRPMQQVFHQAGFQCRERWVSGEIEVSFPIAATQRYLEALIGRDLLAVRARLRPLLERAGSGGLGVVCRTPATGEAVVAACRSSQVGVSTVVVTDELGVDLNTGLAYLASGDDCDVIAVEAADLVRPRRFVVLGRQATRRRPLVALIPSGRPAGFCHQMGAEQADRVEDLVDRVRELLVDRRAGAWQPPVRGGLVEARGCDPTRARAVLDEVTGSVPSDDLAPRPLQPAKVRELLAAYGVPAGALGRRDVHRKLTLTVDDLARRGLAARIGSGLAGAGQEPARLLPLTDRDAEELVHASAPECADPEVLVDRLLRAAWLIDDQPEVCRIQIPLGAPAGAEHPEATVWFGPRRGTDDDPFVRRLPADARLTIDRPTSQRHHDRGNQ